MGASLTMIDRHYGHLARDGRVHAIRLLDELSAGQRPRWTLVDAAWTPTLAVRQLSRVVLYCAVRAGAGVVGGERGSSLYRLLGGGQGWIGVRSGGASP